MHRDMAPVFSPSAPVADEDEDTAWQCATRSHLDAGSRRSSYAFAGSQPSHDRSSGPLLNLQKVVQQRGRQSEKRRSRDEQESNFTWEGRVCSEAFPKRRCVENSDMDMWNASSAMVMSQGLAHPQFGCSNFMSGA